MDSGLPAVSGHEFCRIKQKLCLTMTLSHMCSKTPNQALSMSVPAGQQLLSLACLCLSWSSATSAVQCGLMSCALLGLASVCRWGCSERVMACSNIEPHQPTFSEWSKGPFSKGP